MHNTCISFMRNSTRHQSSYRLVRRAAAEDSRSFAQNRSITRILSFLLMTCLVTYVEGTALARCLLNWWAVAGSQWGSLGIIKASTANQGELLKWPNTQTTNVNDPHLRHHCTSHYALAGWLELCLPLFVVIFSRDSNRYNVPCEAFRTFLH